MPDIAQHEPPAEAEEAEHKDYVALKFTFTPTRGEVGGAFCLVFEGLTGDILEQELWVTRVYAQRSLTVGRDWRDFIERFSRLGPYDKLLGDRLIPILPELVPPEDRMELFKAEGEAVKRQLSRIEEEVRKGFERATQCFFDVASEAQLLVRSELEKAGVLKSEHPEPPAEEAKPEGPSESDGRTVIKCVPIIDPREGKPLSKIAQGDIVEVGIVEEGAGALVQKFLTDSRLTPTFPVEEIIREEDKTYVYLHVNDEIRGLMTLRTDLRLKMKRPYGQKSKSRVNLEDVFLFAAFGIASICLVLALYYIF